MIRKGGRAMTDEDRDEGAVKTQDQSGKPPTQTLRPPGVSSREEFGKRG